MSVCRSAGIAHFDFDGVELDRSELRSFGFAGGSTEAVLRILAELWLGRSGGNVQGETYPERRA